MDSFIFSTAWACPACYWANPKGFAAYIGSTILMSLLPLALLAGIVWSVRRYLR